MKAVIFDRDGIIIDSEQTHIDSVREAFSELGIQITQADSEYIIGKHWLDYKTYFQEKYDFDYEQFRKLQPKKYYSQIKKAPVFENAIILLKELSQDKVLTALCTSSGNTSTEIVLEMLDLRKHLNAIITNEKYSKRKPDPEPYLLTAKTLGVLPQECVVIEDTDIGVQAAKAAGMTCVAIPNKHTINRDFSAADMIVNSAADLNKEILESLCNKQWLTPPDIKIYEALGCIGDKRISIDTNTAKVISSSGNKAYEVTYDQEHNAIMANDNGSYWIGYLGYPSISFLMLKGELPYKQEYAEALKEIHWKNLNQKYNNRFEKTKTEIHKIITKQHIDLDEFKAFVQEVLTIIEEKNFLYLGAKQKPPKGY